MRVNNVPAVRVTVSTLGEALEMLRRDNVRVVAWPHDMISPQLYVFVIGQ